MLCEVFQTFIVMTCLLILVTALIIKILTSTPFYDPHFANVIKLNNQADKKLGIDVWLLKNKPASHSVCLGDGYIIHRTHGSELPVRQKLTSKQAELANSCPSWAEHIDKTSNDPSIGIN
ncbi:hypothetical protein C8N29_13811 [Agitococcus lubricus]|uniref:Uncharacterized protein n=1 Tax=Agitococcus lubricus TaxID=1077255 RepID=A0A2T5IRW6_9GAMM|nr:hypothetical protein C8N29_13811 [Agitococcus lubricus]